MTLNEKDGPFSPDTGGRQLHHNPKFDMTHLPKETGDEMQDYERTEDESTEKTDDIKKKYAEKNHKMWGTKLPITTQLGT
jgi:hypothetical protein